MIIIIFNVYYIQLKRKDNRQGYLREIIGRIRSGEGVAKQIASSFVSIYRPLNYKLKTMRNTKETDFNEAILCVQF